MEFQQQTLRKYKRFISVINNLKLNMSVNYDNRTNKRLELIEIFKENPDKLIGYFNNVNIVNRLLNKPDKTKLYLILLIISSTRNLASLKTISKINKPKPIIKNLKSTFIMPGLNELHMPFAAALLCHMLWESIPKDYKKLPLESKLIDYVNNVVRLRC